MPSSTSSFEAALPLPRHAPTPGLRLTASDRPGVAQPVPERDIPDRPWRAMALAALAITLALTGLWELRMRQLELRPGDLHDSASAWAEQRRRLRTEPVQVAIAGDSRILFDTDLDRFEQLTGVRPVQLALVGTNARPFVEDIGKEPKFKGLLIVGIAEVSYFRKEIGLNAAALDVGRWESPASRGSFLIRREVSRHLALMDKEYSLSKLVARLDKNQRPGVRGPMSEPWKLSENFDDRQTRMWPRIEKPGPLQDHARFAWGGFKRPSPKPEVVALTQQVTRIAVERIRARGGDVIFLRPPSDPSVRGNEERTIPRKRGWDALLATAKVKGLHFEDMPAAQGLETPELSHLSGRCATVYTDIYVRALTETTPRLKLRPDAPPPLSRADCVPAPATRLAAARAPE
jgi:hypothetical protein